MFQSLSGFQVRCNSLVQPGARSDAVSFNPCRVFKCAATYIFSTGRGEASEFQSLSGFQVRCNAIGGVVLRAVPGAFQSLSGFQVRCNYRLSDGIPSQELVSIPVGFSSALQRTRHPPGCTRAGRFQSLSGFQVRCNLEGAVPADENRVVSIPVGFSSALQREGSESWTPGARVSIPVGFSSALQRHYLPCCNRASGVSIPVGFSSALQLPGGRCIT